MHQLSWQELSSILLEYEDKSNYDTLKTFAAKYYPTATRVEVWSICEYDDSRYHQIFDETSIGFFHGEHELGLPQDEAALDALFALSPTLKAEFETAQPDEPLEWLREQYHDEFRELALYGPERGDDLLIDLTSHAPEPTPVYTLPKGESHAARPDA